jgi:DNA-binding transcriptional MerR regulator
VRIGEVAERTGTTPRTIRYYEELGLLPEAEGRTKGKHRVYVDSDVERLEELIRLREALGLTLEELKAIVEAEEARAALRREWHEGVSSDERRIEILHEALNHVATQLQLVRARRLALEQLERELVAKRRRVKSRLKQLLV